MVRLSGVLAQLKSLTIKNLIIRSSLIGRITFSLKETTDILKPLRSDKNINITKYWSYSSGKIILKVKGWIGKNIKNRR